MICQWQDFLNILPPAIRKEVDKQNETVIQEVRLRLGYPVQLVHSAGYIYLKKTTDLEDIVFCVNAASQYSPWSSETARDGYITAPGGHRVGICGTVAVRDGSSVSVRSVSSLCLRVARDFEGVTDGASDINGSVLIIGPPGSGKTTFLRDFLRQRSDKAGKCVCVVDERGEIFPKNKDRFCFSAGINTDVITGCTKKSGIDAALRSMNPDTIAVDEITAQQDCAALINAGWCGVNLIATAHATSINDLYARPVYKPIMESRLFSTVIVMRRDKSWLVKRLRIC